MGIMCIISFYVSNERLKKKLMKSIRNSVKFDILNVAFRLIDLAMVSI